ncbi:MAG: peptidoglycan editing factor PgeF, partial [Candidatus Acidiferrales bacterium]
MGVANRKEDWLIRRAGGAHVLQAARLAKLRWLAHGFSTRVGGASKLDGAHALNLGFAQWDTRASVDANRKKFLAALNGPSSRRAGARPFDLVTLRQVHSDVIHAIAEKPVEAPKGDAAITRAPGLLLAVQTADCLPILLVDAKQRAVAAVHAGWRGTLARIAAKTLGRMQMQFGTRPADVIAAIGPGIGACCYEVGHEVVQSFASQFTAAREWFAVPPRSGFQKYAPSFDELATGVEPMPLKWLTMAPPGHEPPPPRMYLDLAAANRWQLLEAGIAARNIIASALCTACRTDLLFS